MLKAIVGSVLALGTFGILATAQAAPAASGAISVERLAPESAVEETTYRRYRHKNYYRNYGYRSHGYRNYGYRNYGYRNYGYNRPGIYLNFGGYGGRRHW